MNKVDRRAAIRAFKERKTAAGVFAVRCRLTNQVWVGATPTLDTIQTQLWFSLRLGGAPHRDAQAAWAAHGEAAFSFERLEIYDEDKADLMQVQWLKDRAAHWRSKLAAKAI